jgi:hypothetical protein
MINTANDLDLLLVLLFPLFVLAYVIGAYLGGPQLPWFVVGLIASFFQYFYIGYALPALFKRLRQIEWQRPEGRGQRSDVRGNQKSEKRSGVRGRRSEGRRGFSVGSVTQ